MRTAFSSGLLLLSTLAGCAPTSADEVAVAESALGATQAAGPVVAADPVDKAGDPTFSGTVYAMQAALKGKRASTMRYYLADANGKSRPLTLTAAQAEQLGLGVGGTAHGVTIKGALVGTDIVVSSVLTTGS